MAADNEALSKVTSEYIKEIERLKDELN